MSHQFLMRKHRLTRRKFIVASASATICAPSIVHAQPREIVISGSAGETKVMETRVFPILEEKYKVPVLFDSSNSLATLRKLMTEREKPSISIVLMDEPVILDAIAENLIEPLHATAVPNLGVILPDTVRKDGIYVNFKAPRSAIGYNTKSIPHPIESWAEMWNPRYSRRVLIPAMTRTSAVFLITVGAALATGKPFAQAQYETDAGFHKLAELKPNILTIYQDPGRVATLLEQGEGWMAGGLFSSYIVARQRAGAPIELAKPSEGSFALSGSIAKVRNAALPDVTDSIINDFLGEEIQQIMVEEFNDAPANPKVPLKPGMMSLDQMFSSDWEYVAKNRRAWIERFDREIAS